MAEEVIPRLNSRTNVAVAERIKSLVRAFIPEERIAKIVGMSLNDLKNKFPYELGYTDDEELANVADTAYMMAISGRHPDMTKYWLKIKGGVKFYENVLEVDNSKNPLMVIMADEVDEDGNIIEGDYENVGDVELSGKKDQDVLEEVISHNPEVKSF